MEGKSEFRETDEQITCSSYGSLVKELAKGMTVNQDALLVEKGDGFNYEDINSWIGVVNFEKRMPKIRVEFPKGENTKDLSFEVRKQRMVDNQDRPFSESEMILAMAMTEAKMKVVATEAEEVYPAITFQVKEYEKEMAKVREEILNREEENRSLNEVVDSVFSRRRAVVALMVMSMVLAACSNVPKANAEEKAAIAQNQPEITTVTETPITNQTLSGEYQLWSTPAPTPEIFGLKELQEIDAGYLIENNPEILYTVVDAEHPVDQTEIETLIEPNLVKLYDYGLMDNGFNFPVLNTNTEVNKILEPDLVDLVNKAMHDGVSIYVRSGYRSYVQQQIALNNVGGDTSKVELPGQSQHQTGLAIDFSTPENNQMVGLYSGFEETEAKAWLDENAWKYGFVESYINGHNGIDPKAEPHHFVYVGRDIAAVYHQLKEAGWPGDIFDLQEYLMEKAGH